MAQSPSHKFGQIIGEILEKAMIPYFQEFANTNELYLDSIGPRKARPSKKVSWQDSYGNKHDLDFVLERGGSEGEVGTPVAFIESAWRRYTKHSRNKAQEIQGAVLPLATTHSFSAPFLGVVLAGVFTAGAITQLESRGFNVLYFEYESVVEAFRAYNIEASFDEDTTEAEFKKKIKQWDDCADKSKIIQKLVALNKDKVDAFFAALEQSVSRYITEVRILPLKGETSSFATPVAAIDYLSSFNVKNYKTDNLIRFEIRIIYSNGDNIEANFSNSNRACDFLKAYQEPDLKIENN